MRSFRIASLGLIAFTLKADRNLPTYAEVQAKEPGYGCELTAATKTVFVDVPLCRRSPRYAREIVEYCVRVQCLGDDRSYWQRIREAARSAEKWGAETVRLGHWLPAVCGPEVVGATIDAIPAMSLGAGAASRTTGELAEHFAVESGSVAIEEKLSGASSAPKAFSTLALPALIHHYTELDQDVNKLVK